MDPEISITNTRVYGADGALRLFLIILAFLLPFAVIPLSYITIPQSKVLVTAVLFSIAALLWGVTRIVEGFVNVPRSLLLYVGALLPIAYLASTAVAGFAGVSIVGEGIEQDTLASIALMSSLFFLVAFAFAEKTDATRLLVKSIVYGYTVLFVIQIAYIFLPAWVSFGVLEGATANLLGSWHDLGILAGLGLFLSFALASTSYFQGLERFTLIFSGILSAFLLVVVHFQDIFWATAALFVVMFGVRVWSQFKEGSSINRIAFQNVAIFAVGALCVFLGQFGTPYFEKLPAPISITQTEVRPSWQGTFDIARQSLQEPVEFFFGAGPNSFIREWGLHKPAGVNATPFWDSDFNTGVGIIPTSVFTSGVVGLIAWGALILILLGYALRAVYESFQAKQGQFTLAGALLLTVGYLVAYHMIYTPGNALTALTFVSLGILVAHASRGVSRRISVGAHDLLGAIRLMLLVFLVLSAVAAAFVLAREVVSNIFVNRAAYVYRATNAIPETSAVLGTALRISPNNDRAHRAAAEIGIIQLSQMLANTDADNKEAVAALQSMLQSTIQHGLNAVTIDADNYQNWLLVAQIYGSLAGAKIEGSYAQARSAYVKAVETHPTNPIPRLRLAQLASVEGDVATARSALQEAIALKPDFAAAYYLLSQVEARDGKGDAAVAAGVQAVQLVPGDPLGWFNLGYILYSGAQYQDATASLVKAVELAPEYSNALFYLGLSLYQLNDTANAVIAFDRVAQLNPTEVWVQQVVINLRAGKQPFDGIANAPQGN